MKRSLQILAAVAGLVVVVATIMPVIEGDAWWIRVFDFPRIQTLVLALVAAPLAYVAWAGGSRTRWAFAGVMLACAAAQTFKILPYTPLVATDVDSSSSDNSERSVKLLVANILMENRDAQPFLREIDRLSPDIIAVLEPDAWWEEQLAPLMESYAYTVLVPQEDTYGMLVYSRLRLSDVKVEYLFEADVPSVHASVELRSGEVVGLHILHPKPPGPTKAKDTEERDAEILTVGLRVADRERPAIVAGDLNDVAWSSTTAKFQEVSGLLDPRVGRGMFNSYNAKNWFLRWPLDHVFHSDDFRLVAIERGPPIGSDHFPIFIHLELGP